MAEMYVITTVITFLLLSPYDIKFYGTHSKKCYKAHKTYTVTALFSTGLIKLYYMTTVMSELTYL